MPRTSRNTNGKSHTNGTHPYKNGEKKETEHTEHVISADSTLLNDSNGSTSGTTATETRLDTSELQFGWWVPNVSGGLVISKIPQRTEYSPEYNVKLAQTAEKYGFSHGLSQIRFMGGYGAEYQHESVSISQHILAHTEKVKIIAAILPGPWKPALAAKQLASIDHYSKGRIAVNVVSGWFATEFRSIGEPWLEHSERYRRSEEFIQALRGIWTAKESFTFHGNFYNFNEYPLRPQPIQKPGPEIFQGGNSKDARSMAARVSDLLLLNGQSTIKDIQELVEDTKQRAIAEGRGGQVRFGLNAFIICRPTEEEAFKTLHDIVGQADTEAVDAFLNEVKHAGKSASDGKGMWANTDTKQAVQFNDGFKAKLIGTPDQIVDRILLFKSLGISFLLTAFLHFQEELEAFGREIVPRVRELEKSGRGVDVEVEAAISGHIYQ
ncbi:hypothetical protein OIO90_001957 [Microbotryomycetes sp. JL221]|nr:hypothetical protein OIO90_001957 [Microbotryomycetes sp. JL221]